MDPTPYFIMGTLFGAGSLLLIQAYGRRRVRKAMAPGQPARSDDQAAGIAEMRQRVETLERIITEQPLRLEHEIERLR